MPAKVLGLVVVIVGEELGLVVIDGEELRRVVVIVGEVLGSRSSSVVVIACTDSVAQREVANRVTKNDNRKNIFQNLGLGFQNPKSQSQNCTNLLCN